MSGGVSLSVFAKEWYNSSLTTIRQYRAVLVMLLVFTITPFFHQSFPSLYTNHSPSPTTNLSLSLYTNRSPSPSTNLSPSPSTNRSPSPSTNLSPSPSTNRSSSPSTNRSSSLIPPPLICHTYLVHFTIRPTANLFQNIKLLLRVPPLDNVQNPSIGWHFETKNSKCLFLMQKTEQEKFNHNHFYWGIR